MEDRLIAYRRRRERVLDYKEAAAKSCYSLIIIVTVLILLRPIMVDQILSRADAYSSVGLLDESKRQCDKALLIGGDNSGVWCQLARIYRTRGERDAAYGAYLKAVQTDSANRLAHFELGMMYVEDGRHLLAIPLFEQIRRLGPERPASPRTAATSCHRPSLEMLILCYDKERDADKLEMARKEMKIFYPHYRAVESLLPQPMVK